MIIYTDTQVMEKLLHILDKYIDTPKDGNGHLRLVPEMLRLQLYKTEVKK